MKNDSSSSKETERESSARAYSMGDCTRKCKRNIAAVEGSGSSTSTSTAVSKRLRIVGLPSLTVELENPLSCVALPGNVASPANSVDTEAVNAGALSSSFCSDQLPASWCSSNESSEVVKDSFRLMDLKAKSFETVDSACIDNTKFSRETTPSSELCGESDEIDSLARKLSAAKTPPKEEIEEFFAKAEKQEQKRFAEKYNYDIVKDMPWRDSTIGFV
ncbi:cyclin-dependent kinase inhibitor 7-like isoform X1 [Juglans microcarpa x Juglans regia]|uniref:cyclin-dependent kinase inhibitor 7-like isoform X1 n=1 Tax=Juglans microcarpa x Juglans regia TaxID=2249226 RepID=UPI001B7EF6FA|nr:cyclin-dependent kinase inhibitor 7-like isoform X1 [Juglans microcarpa x Juglans regia]